MPKPSSQERIALVTGATSGIGKATAQALATTGMTVVVLGRDRTRTEATMQELRAATGNPQIEMLIGDLSRQADVRQLAARYLERHNHLDILINNAGAGFAAYTESADRIEMTWALNHLAPFLLTHLLMNALLLSPDARVINVTSSSHRGARIHFDDVNLRTQYSANRAYGQSKLANIMFTFALARHLAGTSVRVHAVDPGPVATNLFASETMAVTTNPVLKFGFAIHRMVARPAEEGASTISYLASSAAGRSTTGKHWSKMHIVEPAAAAKRQADQLRLWELSEQMTGVGAAAGASDGFLAVNSEF